MVHTLEIPYFVKRMSIERFTNTLQFLTQKGSLMCLQLSQKNPKLYEPTSFIESSSFEEQDRICQFEWLSRASHQGSSGIYAEGSLKGKIWLRDVYLEQEKMMKLQTDFTDKIKTMHFDQEKNILFASSKDGKFRSWKLPLQWGSKEME
jgi:hypothetical protein